jgi:hypothetical protein
MEHLTLEERRQPLSSPPNLHIRREIRRQSHKLVTLMVNLRKALLCHPIESQKIEMVGPKLPAILGHEAFTGVVVIYIVPIRRPRPSS